MKSKEYSLLKNDMNAIIILLIIFIIISILAVGGVIKLRYDQVLWDCHIERNTKVMKIPYCLDTGISIPYDSEIVCDMNLKIESYDALKQKMIYSCLSAEFEGEATCLLTTKERVCEPR